ncbi:unnamed protein product, partial [Ixodes pacificus]
MEPIEHVSYVSFRQWCNNCLDTSQVRQSPVCTDTVHRRTVTCCRTGNPAWQQCFPNGSSK